MLIPAIALETGEKLLAEVPANLCAVGKPLAGRYTSPTVESALSRIRTTFRSGFLKF